MSVSIHRLPFLLALVLLATASSPHAQVPIRLDVTYSLCCIVEGPLSLGLDELPAEIHAGFVFLAPSWPPPTNVPFDPEVVFASLTLGDAHMTAANLQYFTVAFSISDEQLVLSDLTYLGVIEFWGLEVGNSSFEINITGTDKASGEFFHYHCDRSAQTFEVVTSVSAYLDIKPGSCPNAFDPGLRGVLPVALMPDGAFVVDDVDLSSLTLARADGVGGAVAPLDGPGRRPVIDDVATPFAGDLCDCHAAGGDGTDDLSLKFDAQEVSQALELAAIPAGDELELLLRGALNNGTLFEASDCMWIVPRRAPAPGPMNGTGTLSRLQVRPNPGRVGSRTIAFELRSAGWTEVEVFDVRGRRVSVPFRGHLGGGPHVIQWDGRTRDRRDAPQGIYVVRVRSGGETKTVKMVTVAGSR